MENNNEQNNLIKERLRIGQLIKSKRQEKGLTHHQLADQMGIHYATISKIENGKWNFGIDTLNAFAKFLEFEITLASIES